jgi:hypothetical protein
MLSQQLRNYEAMFVELAQQMNELINHHQKEANREFTPAIAAKLSEAYEACVVEQGPGQYVRMKAYMNDHVDSNLNMFEDSLNRVKKKLVTMTEEIEAVMGNKADEVFLLMSRDYLEVLTGSKVDGVTMLKWEGEMRAEVAKIIEGRERANAEADAAEERARSDSLDTNASAVESAEGRSPDEQRAESSDTLDTTVSAAEPAEATSPEEQSADFETSESIATDTTCLDTSEDPAQISTAELANDEMVVDALPVEASTVSEESMST